MSKQIKDLTEKEREEYERICLSIWGAMPIDVDWATTTKIYQDALSEANKSKNL